MRQGWPNASPFYSKVHQVGLRNPAKLRTMALEKRALALSLRQLPMILSPEAGRAHILEFADDAFFDRSPRFFR
jgi:hypothetical protein